LHDLTMAGRDERAAAQQILRKLTKSRAFVEALLGSATPLDGVRSIELQPKTLLALTSRLDPRFGEGRCPTRL